jgi:hypothetical protein
METEDRWYVRFRGHTLGPLTSEQVKSSVRRKELGPDDKLASTSNPAWRPLRTQEEFLRCWEALTRPVPAELAPLPSPKILWQKKRAPLPAAPATQPIEPKPVAAPLQPEPKQAAPKASTARAAAAPAKPKAKAKPAKKAKPARRPAKPKVKSAAEPAAPVAVAPIPEKPEMKPAEVIAEASAPIAPVPMASEAAKITQALETPPAPKLAEETLSLLEALRDWNRKEKEAGAKAELAAPAPKPAPEPVSPLALSRPEFAFAPSAAVPVAPPAAAAGEKRGIELRLNLVISKQFIFISGLVAALAAAAVIYTLIEAKKMRGPVDSRLPDPSSPTIEPSPKDDPIPQLKAPTRPRRD